MKPHPTSPKDLSDCDLSDCDLSDCDQCLLYLSGDLTEADRMAFESRLATSSSLAAELSSQSELLCTLGEAYWADPAIPVEPKPLVPSTTHLSTTHLSTTHLSTTHLSTTHERTFGYRHAVLVIAASLASVLGWALYQKSSDVNPIATALPSLPAEIEEDMLARAWATTNTEIHFWQDDLDIDADTDAFPTSALDDTSLSWITSSWISNEIETADTIDG